MTERPILMSGPMVQAILRGAKTQTRKPIKPQPNEDGLSYEIDGAGVRRGWLDTNGEIILCPFGVPGDRLWVKEGFCYSCPEGMPQSDLTVTYRADVDEVDAAEDRAIRRDFPELAKTYAFNRWRPSIHLPRWASRITLEVERVWAERVQDISEADCQAEGIRESYLPDGCDLSPARFRPRELFRNLWNSINGPGAWDRNDWTWACEFKQAQP